MSGEEFIEWQAYDLMTEIGPTRHDYNAAKICQTIALSQGVKKRGGTMFTVSDFLIDFDMAKEHPTEPQPTQSPEEMLDLFKALTMGGNE